MRSTICVAEDREACEPCLKVLLSSLTAHCPGTEVSLFYPLARRRFVEWVKRCPQVRIQEDRLANGYGWNVKPQAILNLLDHGIDEVIWIDSDVVVTRNPQLSLFESHTLVTTENTLVDERTDRDGLRARLWHLPVGRVLPFSLNSCVLRVTRVHYALLQRWWELLQSNDYQESQRKEWRSRPIHMMGDQDVLTALLSSEEFAGVSLRILRRGREIIQFDGIYGYTVAERTGSLLGRRPAFVHSCAGKPWSESWAISPGSFLREYVKKVYLDVSPYTIAALAYREQLECETKWMDPHYGLSRFFRAIGLGSSALIGFPMSVLGDVARLAASLRKIGRRPFAAALEDAGLQPRGK